MKKAGRCHQITNSVRNALYEKLKQPLYEHTDTSHRAFPLSVCFIFVFAFVTATLLLSLYVLPCAEVVSIANFDDAVCSSEHERYRFLAWCTKIGRGFDMRKLLRPCAKLIEREGGILSLCCSGLISSAQKLKMRLIFAQLQSPLSPKNPLLDVCFKIL